MLSLLDADGQLAVSNGHLCLLLIQAGLEGIRSIAL